MLNIRYAKHPVMLKYGMLKIRYAKNTYGPKCQNTHGPKLWLLDTWAWAHGLGPGPGPWAHDFIIMFCILICI